MVKVYTKENCIQCKQTKKYLKLRGIEFTEILASNKDIDMLKSMGVQAMPAVFKDETLLFTGFRPSEVNRLL